MNTTLANVGVSEVSFLGDFDQVHALLTVEGTDCECLEYIDEGIVNSTADSHMNVNGIYNVESRKSEPSSNGV